MDNKARCIEVRTVDGKPILRFYLFDKGIPSENRTGAPVSQKGERSDGNLMTEAQKRFLFRLMADQGFERDAAHEHLKELFLVESLKEVSKMEASKMIERLLEEAKGGEHDGPPF